MSSEHITWLSQSAYDRLAAELAERQGPLRQEIVERIAAARAEGDLSENGGYHAAREEQGKNEARVKELTHLLENCKIGQPDVEDGVAHIGRLVTVEFPGGDQETYVIASHEKDSEHDPLSPSSPLGGALIGRRIGDDVTYKLPSGKELTVLLVDVQSL